MECSRFRGIGCTGYLAYPFQNQERTLNTTSLAEMVKSVNASLNLVLPPSGWTQIPRYLVNVGLLGLLFPPLAIKLGRSEIAQGGMDALVHVDLIEKASDLPDGISIIHVV